MLSPFLGKLVQLEGIVTKCAPALRPAPRRPCGRLACSPRLAGRGSTLHALAVGSLVHPKLVTSVHHCQATGHVPP